ncbi:hypothetical protein [Lignipirellula cremea]|uniref:Uncharacterized protein n=1 Tax=Lignipirellula cremea TaxID=2528010 RepID=A0A518E0M2_9BACT|nr:hypothetical protein [Lignipirellula cremea]QDU97646.1 hypothetical protein Pla8534_54970 [Lignipirellula cremea]
MEIIINAQGQGRCVYDEAIDLSNLGVVSIRRASHVEPTSNGRWTADLGPVGGPMLGPFDRRSNALDAERQWLADHWLSPYA